LESSDGYSADYLLGYLYGELYIAFRILIARSIHPVDIVPDMLNDERLRIKVLIFPASISIHNPARYELLTSGPDSTF
jgi:hypothetical protein